MPLNVLKYKARRLLESLEESLYVHLALKHSSRISVWTPDWKYGRPDSDFRTLNMQNATPLLLAAK
ncbi:unnamed protein product [Ixodes persulcatus]